MTNLAADNELETELQEVYMQATHWLQDIFFLETETAFFRNIINRYQALGNSASRKADFEEKIGAQEKRLAGISAKISGFQAFLKPFIGDLKKPIDLGFLERYNLLKTELDALFTAVRATKKDLFQYTESIMAPIPSTLAGISK